MSRRFISSKPPHCVSPRPHTDAELRRHVYGKIQPMEEDEPGLLARLWERIRG